MLSMSDGELTNILLTIIGALLMVVVKGIMMGVKGFRDWCKRTDRTLQDHEKRLVGLEAVKHEQC